MAHKTRLYCPLFLISLLLAACSFAATPPPSTPVPLAREIIFYNWEGDDLASVRQAFAEEYGVTVNYASFASQEEAAEQLMAGEEAYDLVVLEHQFFPQLLAANELAEIDYSNVPNFKNIWANFRDLSHDPDNLHSVPFSWGATFLIYRADLVDRAPTDWADLWRLRRQGKIGMPDSLREPLGVALKSLGYSLNSEDPAEIQKAYEHLLELKDDIVLVDSYAEGAGPLLESGQIVALVGWAEHVEYSQQRSVPVDYVFPADGALLWGDNFVIPAGSPNQVTAELFLDFLMRPDINARIVNETYYATANEAAREYIDPEILNNPVIFPPVEKLKNAEVILPLSPETVALYHKLWDPLLAEIKPE